jgi:hypothetical protein
VSSPPPSPEDGNRSSFRNVVFSRIPDDGKSPKPPVILCVHFICCGNCFDLICHLVFQNSERKHRTEVFVLVVTEELPEWEDAKSMGRV